MSESKKRNLGKKLLAMGLFSSLACAVTYIDQLSEKDQSILESKIFDSKIESSKRVAAATGPSRRKPSPVETSQETKKV